MIILKIICHGIEIRRTQVRGNFIDATFFEPFFESLKQVFHSRIISLWVALQDHSTQQGQLETKWPGVISLSAMGCLRDSS